MQFLFIIWLVLEIVLLIEIGGQLGAFLTLIELAVTFFVGLSLLQMTGRNWLSEIQQLSQGQVIWQRLLTGIMLRRVIGSLLIMVPGFLTDFIGLGIWVWSFIAVGTAVASGHKEYKKDNSSDFVQREQQNPRSNGDSSGRVIEGDYERDDHQP